MKFNKRDLPKRPKGVTMPALLKIVLEIAVISVYNYHYSTFVNDLWHYITSLKGTHKEEFTRQIFWHLTYKHFGYHKFANGFHRKELARFLGKESCSCVNHSNKVIEGYLAEKDLSYNAEYAKIIKAIEAEIIKLK